MNQLTAAQRNNADLSMSSQQMSVSQQQYLDVTTQLSASQKSNAEIIAQLRDSQQRNADLMQQLSASWGF